MKKINLQKEIIERLKQKGVKITPQRLAIIAFLENKKSHSAAEGIFNELKEQFPSISFATIYNTLEMLENIGEVIKLKISDDNKVHYDYNTEPHHHFYCRECGQIFDIDISCPVSKMGNIEGHIIEEVHGYFKGICADCKKHSNSN